MTMPKLETGRDAGSESMCVMMLIRERESMHSHVTLIAPAEFRDVSPRKLQFIEYIEWCPIQADITLIGLPCSRIGF